LTNIAVIYRPFPDIPTMSTVLVCFAASRIAWISSPSMKRDFLDHQLKKAMIIGWWDDSALDWKM